MTVDELDQTDSAFVVTVLSPMFLNEWQRYENLIAGARERLGSRYEAERRAGTGLTLEQAIAEARRHVP